jgi:hypothetical protein
MSKAPKILLPVATVSVLSEQISVFVVVDIQNNATHSSAFRKKK